VDDEGDINNNNTNNTDDDRRAFADVGISHLTEAEVRAVVTLVALIRTGTWGVMAVRVEYQDGEPARIMYRREDSIKLGEETWRHDMERLGLLGDS